MPSKPNGRAGGPAPTEANSEAAGAEQSQFVQVTCGLVRERAVGGASRRRAKPVGVLHEQTQRGWRLTKRSHL